MFSHYDKLDPESMNWAKNLTHFSQHGLFFIEANEWFSFLMRELAGLSWCEDQTRPRIPALFLCRACPRHHFDGELLSVVGIGTGKASFFFTSSTRHNVLFTWSECPAATFGQNWYDYSADAWSYSILYFLFVGDIVYMCLECSDKVHIGPMKFSHVVKSYTNLVRDSGFLVFCSSHDYVSFVYYYISIGFSHKHRISF